MDRIRERIAQACQRAGRSSSDVTLIGVTKTFPLDIVTAAQAVGLHDFGENKVQELVEKAQTVPGRTQGGDVTWHMIGHLQRNKARDAVRYADVFHGLGSFRLAEELEKRAALENRVLPCLVQVNVSGEASKSGTAPDQTHDLLDRLGAFPHLELRGLMTIAEPAADPEYVRPQFRLLRTLFDTYRPVEDRSSVWQWLSMGMSDDFEVAVEEGATHVRIGSALFGVRSYP
jgi:PLP dependent protein